jgi:hypothetical protein
MTSVINRMLCLVAVPFLLVPLANDAQRKKRQKVCSRSRRGRKVIVATSPSAQREMQNERNQTRPFGFSGANAIPTRCGCHRTWPRVFSV